MQKDLMTVVLAAGMGTRMKSGLPKVLHKVAGRPMVSHVLSVAQEAGAIRHAVVVGHGAQAVEEAIAQDVQGVETFLQDQQLGTAHAVLAARKALDEFSGYVAVLYGDTPLLVASTITKLVGQLDNGADIAVLGFETADPFGYGRLLVNEQGELVAIREQKDASPEEQKVTFCNSGVFAFRSDHLLGLLDRIGNDNAKGEYYLTDVVEIARQDGLKVVTLTCVEEEVLGVNDRVQLSDAEQVIQSRKRREAMEQGVTLIAPETVFFSHDTRIGQDVMVEPHVYFGPGVTVENDVTIRAFSHFEACVIRRNAVVGPYARIRPDADIGESARIGNFVEVKKAVVEQGAKVNHLSYIGDARVGANANIGAGTIICNYDGFLKHHTDIGEYAFVGSNSALVAPVKIGDGAYVGSGSVITEDVEQDALALTRATQTGREGWAAKYRARKQEEKRNKK